MKKMMLAFIFLVTTGIFTANAQVRVVVRSPNARLVVRRPIRPLVASPSVVVTCAVIVEGGRVAVVRAGKGCTQTRCCLPLIINGNSYPVYR